MNKRNTRTLALLVIGLIIISCGAKKDDTRPPQQKTPEDYVEQATFTNLQGDSLHVADFKGKVVMIDFWETWCKPCIASFPTLDKLQKEYSDDFVILAVTPGFTDTRKDAKAFADEHDYSFIFLMDSEGLHKKLEVQSIPYKVFVDAEGNFIKSSTGSYGADDDSRKVKAIIEQHKAVGSEQ